MGMYFERHQGPEDVEILVVSHGAFLTQLIGKDIKSTSLPSNYDQMLTIFLAQQTVSNSLTPSGSLSNSLPPRRSLLDTTLWTSSRRSQAELECMSSYE